MRIAFVYDALYPYTTGGGERRYWELARRMATDHEVHMVSWQYWDGPPTIERDGVTIHGVGRAPGLYGEDGRRTIREAIGFGIAVGRWKPPVRFDVIDSCAFPYFHLFAQRVRAWRRQEPLVVTWHEYWGEYWHEYLRGLAGYAGRLVERASLPMADRYLAVSRHTARRLGEPPTSRPVEVVPNGIDLAVIDGQAERYAGCTPVSEVLYVGRLIRHKRVDSLLHSVAQLRTAGHPVCATIVGSGPDAATLRALATELGIDSAISWVEDAADEQMYQLMRGARLLVLPSEREGFGMTVLEAAACGTPSLVVRAPHSAATEIVCDGRTGVVTDPSPEAMAAGIRRVLESPGEAERLGECARAHAEQFDWRHVVDETLGVYDRAIAAKRG